ncbi:gnk2-like domain-containing protein [Artemisia annua]|uniref:Gnk2-like domain-containing protein n=1 Tax=Artemisia annua TaxID=35608 RepID=A0A2U1MZ62_ARTAN|nr:gnk2-like domain-containing protein [Artemisia annua]
MKRIHTLTFPPTLILRFLIGGIGSSPDMVRLIVNPASCNISLKPSLSAANSLVYYKCSQLYFTPMTLYESNVNSLFTSLVDSASVCNFNTLKISSPDSSRINDLSGLFQCRGDLNFSNCQDCVANSLSQLRTTCPVSISGTLQSEGCFVKYDNTSFLGVEDKMEVFKRCGPSVGYNSDNMDSIDKALTHLTTDNQQYFRAGGYGGVNGVAQCTQDITLDACEDCLLEARARLRSECQTSIWSDMYLGSCYIRYGNQAGIIIYKKRKEGICIPHTCPIPHPPCELVLVIQEESYGSSWLR